MPDNNQAGRERLLKRLLGSIRCRVCRTVLGREHIRITAQFDDLWIVSVRCRQCRHQQVYWISLEEYDSDADEPDESETALHEQERLAALPPITYDDVLDMHEFLASFEGNVSRLLGES